MKYLKIKNDGMIEVEAFTLVGASTKRGDSSTIGQFGTGNKYALAYLIKNGYDIRIFSGNNEFKLSTVEAKLGFDTYDRIVINGEPTSITTTMGKDWKFWMAIREFYSNALDKDNAEIEIVNVIEPADNETHIYIGTNDEVFNFISNFKNYFADNEDVLFENENGRILKRHNDKSCFYRKGIRCYEPRSKETLYNYDLYNLEINEDRLARYTFEVEEEMWKLLFECDNKEIVSNVLHHCSDSRFMESNEAYVYGEVSDTYAEVIKEMKIAPKGMAGLLSIEEQAKTMIVPTSLFKKLRSKTSEKNVHKNFSITNSGMMYRVIDEKDVSDLKKAVLAKAISFLEECQLPNEYNIVVANFEEKCILGTINKEKSTIVLSNNALDLGVHDTVNTIIEEYIHLKWNVKDETRAFQTASINMLINYAKKMNAYGEI